MYTGSLLPEGEALRNAVRWISDQQSPHNFKQIEEACWRFDLSPADEQFLLRHFLESARPNAH